MPEGSEVMSHMSYKEYFAAYGRMVAECGESRRADTVHPGYYSQKLVAALKNPSAAGPRLARATKLWPGPIVPCWTATGEQIPEGYDVWVRYLRTMVDAIDDDDEAEAERETLIRRFVSSPYLNAEASYRHLGLTSVKALYSLVERVCGGDRKRFKYSFTKEELDLLRKHVNPWGKTF